MTENQKLREALQKAKDALSLALSDVDWRKDSPTQPVIHKAYNCAHQALALPTAEQVDDINVAESFTSVTKTAAPAQEVASAFTTALDIRLAQGWNLTGNAIPVLYTDTINDYQVRRDDVWLCTTDALKTKQEVGLIARQFDLICQAIDKADTATMEGDYMLDSDDCINVIRVMQALFDVTKPAQEVRLTDEVPAHVAWLLEHLRELDAIEFFESTNRDSHKFKKSVRGTYVNPAVARDWKWFQLGMKHATEDES